MAEQKTIHHLELHEVLELGSLTTQVSLHKKMVTRDTVMKVKDGWIYKTEYILLTAPDGREVQFVTSNFVPENNTITLKK